jgi:hypothetical protein
MVKFGVVAGIGVILNSLCMLLGFGNTGVALYFEPDNGNRIGSHMDFLGQPFLDFNGSLSRANIRLAVIERKQVDHEAQD